MMKHKKSLVHALRAAVIFTLLPAAVNHVRAQATAAAAAPPTDVPVREVTLFSSGVGYFQHEGTVSGDGEARLNFKTAQINDVLKSLILQDLDGGHVGVVTLSLAGPAGQDTGQLPDQPRRQPRHGRTAQQDARRARDRARRQRFHRRDDPERRIAAGSRREGGRDAFAKIIRQPRDRQGSDVAEPGNRLHDQAR